MTETPMEQVEAEGLSELLAEIKRITPSNYVRGHSLLDRALQLALSSRAPQAGGEGLRRQNEVQHAVRKLNEPCPFCRQKMVELWRDPREHWLPFQVRCGACFATGPACDCGEESAVPMWLSVQPTPADAPKGDVRGALADAADELERIAEHALGTPGLHYDTLQQLIESAVGIAKAAAIDAREALSTPSQDNGDVRGALTALRNRLAMTSDEHWSAEDFRLARDVWLLSATPSRDEGEARVSDEAHVLIAKNIVENNAEHIAVAALNGLVREIAIALSAAHVAGKKAARPAEGEALRRANQSQEDWARELHSYLALRRALEPFAALLDRPWADKNRAIAMVQSGGGHVSELQAINLADVIRAHEALSLSRSPEDDFSADAWGEKS